LLKSKYVPLSNHVPRPGQVILPRHSIPPFEALNLLKSKYVPLSNHVPRPGQVILPRHSITGYVCHCPLCELIPKAKFQAQRFTTHKGYLILPRTAFHRSRHLFCGRAKTCRSLATSLSRDLAYHNGQRFPRLSLMSKPLSFFCMPGFGAAAPDPATGTAA